MGDHYFITHTCCWRPKGRKDHQHLYFWEIVHITKALLQSSIYHMRIKDNLGQKVSNKPELSKQVTYALNVPSKLPDSACLLVICRWFKVRVESNHLCDKCVSLLFKLFAGTELSSIKALPLTVVDWLRGRGPAGDRAPLLFGPSLPLLPYGLFTSLPPALLPLRS